MDRKCFVAPPLQLRRGARGRVEVSCLWPSTQATPLDAVGGTDTLVDYFADHDGIANRAQAGDIGYAVVYPVRLPG